MNERKTHNPDTTNSAEREMQKLQNLAERFKSGKITETEKIVLKQIANDYIAKHDTGDYGYYPENPNPDISYNEIAFYDLPNGLCLEGFAGTRQNIFEFGNVLTAEERDRRIEYLESTSKNPEK